MTTNKLISIPIFTYNGEKYLEQQLESIYKQSYQNIEVIACDDASSDDTIKILEKFHISHGLKYFVHKKNVGVNDNVSKAFSLCTGDFIAPCDQDDIWKPEKLQELIDNIKDNVLIYSLSTPIDENNNKINNISIKKNIYVSGNNNNLSFLFTNCISGHTILFKTELLPYLNNIPKSIYPDWWIAFVASSYGSIGFLNKSLVYYRRHSTQLTKTTKKTTKLFQLISKEKKKTIYIENIVKNLLGFTSLSLLDIETKKYILELKENFEIFSDIYYNKKLEKLLSEKEDLIFKIHGNKTSKYTKRFSRGIWYFRVRLYL